MEPVTTCEGKHCFCLVTPDGHIQCHRCGIERATDENLDQGANS